MEEFYIGQIFEGIYPPEAAVWVNSHNAYIEELEGGNNRRFEIKIVPESTEEEIKQRRSNEIKNQLTVLDTQRIRALAEPSVKDETTGETWLEYYNNQVLNLRQELRELESSNEI